MREEERSSMLGIKTRNFVPLVNVSLEELVPADHFYRQLEQKLRVDLSFVRGLTGKSYARGGRPSIHSIVFLKLQLVMFFDGIRSERQLMQLSADRLSVRWYLGYDLNEPLPDHSSLTRIRGRYRSRSFAAFLKKSRANASRLDWCGEKNCSWIRPKCRPMPLSILSKRVLPLKLISRVSSLKKEKPSSSPPPLTKWEMGEVPDDLAHREDGHQTKQVQGVSEPRPPLELPADVSPSLKRNWPRNRDNGTIG